MIPLSPSDTPLPTPSSDCDPVPTGPSESKKLHVPKFTSSTTWVVGAAPAVMWKLALNQPMTETNQQPVAVTETVSVSVLTTVSVDPSPETSIAPKSLVWSAPL